MSITFTPVPTDSVTRNGYVRWRVTLGMIILRAINLGHVAIYDMIRVLLFDFIIVQQHMLNVMIILLNVGCQMHSFSMEGINGQARCLSLCFPRSKSRTHTLGESGFSQERSWRKILELGFCCMIIMVE